MYIGESFVGEGVNAAHVNVVLGPREGPVGAAWASAIAGPSAGHVPFMAVLQPGVPVKPVTVFINKATLHGEKHEALTWGAAQAGVALGVQERLLDGTLPRESEDGWCVIAAVWVNPAADDADAVYANNHSAASAAVFAAMNRLPSLGDVRRAAERPWNAYFRPPGETG